MPVAHSDCALVDLPPHPDVLARLDPRRVPVADRARVVEVQDERGLDQVPGGVADDQRPPGRAVRRRSPHLDAIGQRDQRRAQRRRGGLVVHRRLHVHRRVVDQVRLVQRRVAGVARVDGHRRRGGIHLADRRAAPEFLVPAPGAELGGDPPRGEVIGELELRVLRGDREPIHRPLPRQDIAEADAVVEDAEHQLQLAPRRGLLAQVDRKLVVSVADRLVLAPHRPPDGVSRARRALTNFEVAVERGSVRELEVRARSPRAAAHRRGRRGRAALPSSSSSNSTAMLRSGEDTAYVAGFFLLAASADGANIASGAATSATANERQPLRLMR